MVIPGVICSENEHHHEETCHYIHSASYQNHSKPTFLMPQAMPLELNRQKSVGHDMANDLGTRNTHQNAASLQPCHMQVFMEKCFESIISISGWWFQPNLKNMSQNGLIFPK